MTIVKFTHANLKSAIYLTREQVWNVYYSEAHRCTHIVSTAGAICPVSENIDEALRLVYGAPVTPLADYKNKS